MASLLLRVAVLAAVALAVSANDGNFPNYPYDRSANRQQCWERCFRVEGTLYENYREVYDDFYRLGMEARRLKNIYGVNGTALLLDSTLAPYHATATSMEDTAGAIFKYQRNLASIIATVMGTDNDHNPFYVVQFDEEGAYSCDEFHCLDSCEAMLVLGTQFDAVETGATSTRRGNLEAACNMARRYIDSATCDATCANEMAIAILNSDAWSRVGRDRHHSSSDSHSWEEGFGPCFAHFDTRMAVGTHAAGWDNLQRWTSGAARAFYLHDNEFTMKAAEELVTCLNIRCCPTDGTFWDSSITGNVCQKTSGNVGENQEAWADHDAAGSP